MNIQRILFPTDFSHASDAALPLATALARDSGATLLIIHVQEPTPAYAMGELYYGVPEPTQHQLREMLEAIVPNDPTVLFEHHLVLGEPAKRLVRFAKEQNVDLIVMGTHGRRALSRLVMGSVAEAVVRRAPCPVLTFKPTAKRLATADAQ